MNQLFAVITGMIISIMIMVNGSLAENTGLLSALVIIHAVGLITTLTLYIKDPGRLRLKFSLPWHYYISGLIGIFLVLSNTICFTRIGVTRTVAFGLLGQAIFSLIIDSIGLFDRPKRSIKSHEAIGIAVIAFGLYWVI